MRILLLLLILAPRAFAGEKTELQWAVCDQNAHDVLQRLGEPGWEREESRITYYESSRPSYLERGLSFRVKEDDSHKTAIVKVRSESEGDEDLPCEWDRYGNRETYTCKMEASVRAGRIWTKSQRDFVDSYYRVDWDELVPFGPYRVVHWQSDDSDFALEALVPGDFPAILELSVRVKSKHSDELYEKYTRQLREKGIPLCKRQEGKSPRLFRELGVSREVTSNYREIP